MHENEINIQHVEIAWLQMFSREIRIAADWKSKLKRLSHLSLCSLAIISVECCNWGIRSNTQDDLGNHNIEMVSAKENCGVNIEGSCGNHIVVNAWQMIVRQIVILMPKLFYLFFLYHGTMLHIPWKFSDSSINQVTRDECWSTICNINRFFSHSTDTEWSTGLVHHSPFGLSFLQHTWETFSYFTYPCVHSLSFFLSLLLWI